MRAIRRGSPCWISFSSTLWYNCQFAWWGAEVQQLTWCRIWSKQEIIWEEFLYSSINYSILAGIDCISLYLLIIFIQLLFNWITKSMSRIRGEKSGLSPQQNLWIFSEVDFAFLWAGIIVSLCSPMSEWATKLNISAGFLSVGWEKVLVGILCWLFIFILRRFTVSSQHSATNANC